jgi:hypothetical protein
MQGKSVCETRYGTAPAVSPDGRNIAFARQKKPITGLRELAKTQEGNDIQFYNCDIKEARTIAQPSSGYLADPEFTSNGDFVVYSVNEPVNGAFGGPVSLGMVDISTLQIQTLIQKQTATAVPCPKDDSSLSGFQKMMCQESRLSENFPYQIFGFGIANKEMIILQGKPVPAAGDMYVASRYSLKLRSVFPKSEDLSDLGEIDQNGVSDLRFQAMRTGEVMVFQDHWKTFSVKNRVWLPEIGPPNIKKQSVYSPDLEYYAAAEPFDAPNHFCLYRVKDGRKLFTSASATGVFDVVWSADSRKLVVVVRPKDASARRYREELRVYSLEPRLNRR